jgi:hypothetical protein
MNTFHDTSSLSKLNCTIQRLTRDTFLIDTWKNDCASLLIRLSYEKSSTKIGLMGGGPSLLNTIELPYLLNVGHNIYNFWCIMHYVMWSSNKLTFSFISILVPLSCWLAYKNDKFLLWCCNCCYLALMFNVTWVVNLIGPCCLHFMQICARSGMKCSVVKQLRWSMQRFWTTSDQNSTLDSGIHLYVLMSFSFVDPLFWAIIFKCKLLPYVCIRCWAS